MSAPERPPIRDDITISLDELEWKRQEGYEFDIVKNVTEAQTICPKCGKKNPNAEEFLKRNLENDRKGVDLECPFCGCRVHIILKSVFHITKNPFADRLEESERRWRK